MVQNDSPMGHGFGQLSAKRGLDDGHFPAGSGEVLGELLVIRTKKVHFVFGIKTKGWALPPELYQSVIWAQVIPGDDG